MKNIKSIIGALPSVLLNRRISAQAPSAAALALVNLVNSHPNWLAEVNRKVLVRTRFGFSIWCDRCDVIGQAIIANGQWEGLLSRTILACMKPGDVGIDIGANIGYDTMLMSTAVGPQGRVFAFEPELQNLSVLLENLRQLEFGNVVVQSTGLSDEALIARISLAPEGNRGTSNLRPGELGPTQPLLVSRLDRLLDDRLVDRVKLVKIDIEGFEHKAILGMGRLLDRVDYLTCEVDPKYLKQCGTSAGALFEALGRHGFKSLCAQPNSDTKWTPSGPDYRIETPHSYHFDVLFYREIGPELQPLIAAAV